VATAACALRILLKLSGEALAGDKGLGSTSIGEPVL
jgi:hypothetical protein